MKTRIAILITILGLFIAGTVSAIEPVPAKKAVTELISNFLEEEINYPAFASENNIECTVLVSLYIQDDGTIDVDAANSEFCKMKDYVTKSIESIEDEELVKYAGQNVKFKIKFKLLK